MTSEPLRIFISTGEVSGDVVGALLAQKILEDRPGTLLFGVGGSRMSEAGVSVDFPTNHLGTIGVSEAVTKIPAFYRVAASIRRRVRRDPPDAAVLIGNDVFNVVLGRWLRSKGVATVSYFPPQVWIWGAIARQISRSFDLVASSFPDEERVYARGEARTAFVGHYLCDTLSPVTAEEREAARERLGLPRGGTVVGLLPGSRAHEVDILAPVLLDAARGLLSRRGDLRFLLPVAEPMYADRIRRAIEARGLSGEVRPVTGSQDAMRASDLLLTASGTATLEASLLGVPMVVVYRVSTVTQTVVRTAIRLGLMESETCALPNLVLGFPAVPELKQKELDARSVESAAWELIADEGRRDAMRHTLLEVTERLASRGTIGQVCGLVLARAALAATRNAQARAACLAPAVRAPLKDGN